MGEQTAGQGTRQGDPAAQGQGAGQGAQGAQAQPQPEPQAQPQPTGGGQTQTSTPGIQAGPYALTLTAEQRAKLLESGVLELTEEQYTGGVRSQIDALRKRAAGAERKLAEIAQAQEASERKSLEEQERFKELYESEKAAHEKDRAARKEDLIHTQFLLAAHKAGIVDPDAALAIAKTLEPYSAVQVSDEGKLSGMDAVIEALVKDKPYLVSQQRHSLGGPSNPANQTPAAPKTLAEAGDQLETALRTGQV